MTGPILRSYPQLIAAASLKPAMHRPCVIWCSGYPQLIAAASLKRPGRWWRRGGLPGYPQLIAAASLKLHIAYYISLQQQRYPQLIAAASLKRFLLRLDGYGETRLSAANRCGLIEAPPARQIVILVRCYPQLIAAASLKPAGELDGDIRLGGYPQLIAAASLKLPPGIYEIPVQVELSAANRCGLIEASWWLLVDSPTGRLSAANRCGLIEAKPSTTRRGRMAPRRSLRLR